MVKYMRKYGLFFIVLILYLSSMNSNDITVFNDIDELNSYNIELNLNTNNMSCIENLNIQSIEININPVYKIDPVFFYKNKNFFIKNVIERLKENGYYSKAYNYLIEPIYIKQVLVFSTKSKIKEILNNCNINYIIK